MSLEGAQEFTTEVAASVKECFAAITDFDPYPTWSSAVREIAVLDRYPDGLARQVEFHLAMPLKTIRYVLEYAYEKPQRLTWHSVDGDIQSIEGAYDFEKIDAHRTRVTCRQAVRTGFWVPGPIRGALERTALRQSVLEFKAEVERRVSQAASKKKPTAATRKRTT
jgi:uncharacterized membrane protein